jgi:hypothetical protein
LCQFGTAFRLGLGLDYQQVAYLFAIAAGIVSSGAIGSLYACATDEAPHFGMLEEADLWTPIRVLVVIFSAPTTLIVNSFWWFIESPPIGLLMILAGLGWSFIQGVVILTKIFGAT